MAQFENIDFPGWEVVRKIGEGSFGGVYEIHRTLPGGRVEKCALKKLSVPRNDGEIQELISQSFSTESITAHYKNQMGELVNEYSLTQELSSCKNVVGCYDVRFIQHDDGIGWDIYIRMELLHPLRQALSTEYQEATVLRLGLDMCNALLACQEHSIIHRDIKPENILVSDRGEFKLGDFGIAKVSERTGTGTMTGTMGYMAPEVANRQHYGPQADIYSLGMVLYWMMNRRTLPFLPYPPAIPSALQRQEAANRRLAGEAFPPPVNGSAELKAIVMKACAYSPAERYQSAQELQQALAACAQPPLIHPQEPTILDIPHPDEPTQDSTAGAFEGIQSKNEPEESPEQKKPVTNRMRTAVIAAVLILACCGIGIFGYLNCWFGHAWQAADCTTAKTCTRCSAVAEEPLGHLWQEATCTTPKTCTRCGITEGESLGHSWEAATCTTPKTCTRCGVTEGEALGHNWLTMEELSYCTRCEFPNGSLKLLPCQSSWTDQTVDFTLSNGKHVNCTALEPDLKIEQCYSLTLCLRITEYSYGNVEGEWGFYIRDLNGTWHLADTFTLSGDYIEAHFEFDEPISFDAWACPCHVLGYSWGFSYSAWLQDVMVFESSEYGTGETVAAMEEPTEAPAASTAPGVLRSNVEFFEDAAIFGQEVLRKEVATITFLPALDNAPADAWDLSEAEDGSVLGWVTGAKGNYDLYIAADGSVIAPRRSNNLFAYYTGLKEINFNGCFNTSSVATMSGMFDGCKSLQSLNLSGFDTSQVADMSFMFSYCENLQSLDLSSFNTSQVVNMQGMFNGCRALTSIDVSNFDTSNVIDMGSMFAECESLTNVELSNFNTSNVIRMRAVFNNCKNLMAIDVSSFNTSRVIDMALMFSGCESLESLNLSGFDTSRVTDMAWMFGFCRNLKSIDLSSFDTSHVTDMDLMFNQCDDLVDLDLENFDFTNVTRFRCFMSDGKRYNGQPWRALFKKEVSRQRVLRDDMAWEEGAAVFGKDVLRSEVTAVTFLDSLEEAPTDAWDLSVEGDKSVLGWVTGVSGDYHFFIAANGVVVAPQYCSYLFFGYTNLRKIEFNNCFDTSDVYSMDSMFDGCTSLTSLDLSSFNTEKVMGMFRMFYNCHSLTELNLTSFRAPRADTISAMFAGCSSLTKLDLSSFNTPYVTCMDYMFSGCKSLNLLNLSGLDTSYVMSMAGMFESCSSLADVDLSNFDFARVIYYDNFMDEGKIYNGKPWDALFL